jgi:DHA1 family tetracycline resistance protein-like MFS transporter
MSSPRRSELAIICLTIFVSMVGFGIVIPLLPDYAKRAPFQLDPHELGWLVGIFSLIQLFTAPLFGKLSDRIGRKPVLLASILGTAIGYFVTGMANTGWMLFLGRIIDGASGGNIATGQACIADVTPPEHRSRSMGLIGAAFGLGFMVGPALGGLLSHWSPAAPFYFAGVLSLANAVLVVWRLPETLPPEHRTDSSRKAPLAEIMSSGRGRFIGLLLAAQLASVTGFAFVHLLFSLFCGDALGYDRSQISYAFAYVGLLGVIVQGGLLRRLLQRPIEKELALAGSILVAISLWLMPRAQNTGAFLGVCAVLALGNGLLVPTLTGMASRYVHGRAQGRVLGVMASAGSLGRFLGPALAALPLPGFFSQIDRTQPLDAAVGAALHHGYSVAFSWAAVLLVVTAVLVAMLRIPREVPVAASVPAPMA